MLARFLHYVLFVKSQDICIDHLNVCPNNSGQTTVILPCVAR